MTEPRPARKRRRGHHEGSLHQQKDGRWRIAISLGRDAEGKRKRRVIYADSKKEAVEKLNALRSKSIGLRADPQRLTLADYLSDWLAHAKAKLAANTWVSYEIAARVHIKPRIGGVRLAALQPSHIAALYAELAEAGTSGRTRENVHLVLNLALKQALKWEYIDRNPCEVVDKPRRERAEVKFWTAEQASAFLDAIESDRLRALYVLAIASGLRQGELFGLKWEDVDLERGQLAVRRSLVEIRGKITEEDPKTESGRRNVALPAIAIDALREHRKRMLAEGNHAATYVFCDTEGGPLRKSNVRRRSFEPLLERAGLPPITFHGLRHSCATMLLTEGVHPRVVQERLGHADVTVTLRTYSHVLPTLQKDAAERIDAVLKKKI